MNNNYFQYPFNNISVSNTFQPRRDITRVNGKTGAEAQLNLMPPNSADLFLDESAAMIWLASKDGTGVPSLTPYDITAHIDKPPVDFEAIEKRLSRLEELYNEHKPDTGSSEQS